MDPLNVTASIIAVLQLSAKVLGYLNDVKDAPKGRTQCAIEILNLNSLLYKLKDHVENGDSRQPWYITVRDLAVENGPLDQFKQALETLQSKITDGGRLKKVGEALAWKFKKEEIAGILDRIERLKSLVEIALQMDHFKLSQAIKDDTNFVRRHVPVIQSGLDEIRQEQNAAKHRRILEWISPTDYPAQQSDIIKRRQEGTGQWFLDAPEFARWLNGPSETLLCPGIPGAGKTMVAAIAIDHLLKSVQNSLIGVAYVYCNYKAQEEQDASSMLAAIVKQLVQAQPLIAEPAELLHKRHADRGTEPSLDDIFGALREVLRKYSTVYIVVDALDECRDSDGTRHQLLAKLRDLQAGRDVRLMATSRFIPGIVDGFREALRLEVQASREDVKRFVAGQTYRLPRCIQRNPTLQDMVQEKIVEAVDGMFLLARLHSDSLLDKTTAKDVKLTLAKLPRGSAALDDAYRDVLRRIDDQLGGHRELAKKVLSWITYAKRPLTTAEICCALAVEPGEEQLDPDKIPNIEDIVSVCAGLVTVDEESDIIRLVHYTTQEFFERTQRNLFPNAEDDLATVCVTYLSFHVFECGVLPVGPQAILPKFDRSSTWKSQVREHIKKYPFLDYASNYWTTHVRRCSKQVELFASSLRLCDVHSESFWSWFEVYWMERLEDAPNWPALTVASNFGLDLIASRLLQVGADVNAEDSYHRTALLRAAENGHYAIVQLLLSRGAHVTDEDHYQGGKPLYLAAKGGHRDIVQLLMHHNADIDDYGDWNHESAVHISAERGHIETVRDLLDWYDDVDIVATTLETPLHSAVLGKAYKVVRMLVEEYGADMNYFNYRGRTPFHYAIEYEIEDLVRYLIDQGAEVNTQASFEALDYEDEEQDYGGTALHCAATAGNFDVLQILLQHSPDFHVQDIYGRTALHRAAVNGHDAIVKLLLESGAEAHSKDNKGWTPLFHAARHGHKMVMERLLATNGANKEPKDMYEGMVLLWAAGKGDEPIVQQLLDKDINIEVKAVGGNDAGQTPLSLAAERGHLAVVQLLLEKGADVEGKSTHTYSGSGQTPLCLAARRGYGTIVQQLLDKGADVEVKVIGGYDAGMTPLTLAAKSGHEAVAQQLLDRGADIEAKPTSILYAGQTALSVAASNGHVTVVQRLLDKGADINSKDNKGRTPLSLAAERGRETVVHQLLSKRADMTITDTRGWTPLNWAAEGGHGAIIELLLDKHANINVSIVDGRTPLNLTAASGHVEVVKLLLVKGADVTVADNDGWTPLNSAATNGHVEVVKLLLEKGSDMTVTTTEGLTPLNAAATNGHVEVVKLLVENGADINAQGGWYGNALQAASAGGHEVIAKLLLENGAEANTQGGRYGNALQAASYRGHEAVVKLLLAKDNVDPDSKDRSNRTPLLWAAIEGHKAVVELLLANDDVDPDSKDETDRTPLSWAAEKGHKAVVKLLLAKDDVDPDSKDRSNRTPLSWAAIEGHEAVVELLLANDDVDPDSKDETDRTPLSWATEKGHKAVKLLLTTRMIQKAKSPTDEFSRTPLRDLSGPRSYVVPQLDADRKSYKVFLNLRLLIDTVLQCLLLSVSEPPIPQGNVRARWKCRCGERLFDDFTELEVGSVKELERELQELEGSANTNRTLGQTISESFRTLWKPIEHHLQKQHPSNSGTGNLLPLEEIRQRSNILPGSNTTQQPKQTSARCQDTLYLLLCIDKGNSGTPLQQEHLRDISTDRKLFFFLRSKYFGHWNAKPWITLRKIRSLSLSRFAVDLSNFTEVHKHVSICSPACVCLPPVDRLDREYHCRPAPEVNPKYEPAIGSQRLTHYFLSPQCVEATQETIIAQLPKRVGHLRASYNHEEIGWGIHFQEGWNWRPVYVVVVVLTLFSLVFGIVWSITKGDIQGAFTISSFCVTLGGLLLGYIVVKNA